jgi:hypothetical protein
MPFTVSTPITPTGPNSTVRVTADRPEQQAARDAVGHVQQVEHAVGFEQPLPAERDQVGGHQQQREHAGGPQPAAGHSGALDRPGHGEADDRREQGRDRADQERVEDALEHRALEGALEAAEREPLRPLVEQPRAERDHQEQQDRQQQDGRDQQPQQGEGRVSKPPGRRAGTHPRGGRTRRGQGHGTGFRCFYLMLSSK